MENSNRSNKPNMSTPWETMNQHLQDLYTQLNQNLREAQSLYFNTLVAISSLTNIVSTLKPTSFHPNSSLFLTAFALLSCLVGCVEKLQTLPKEINTAFWQSMHLLINCSLSVVDSPWPPWWGEPGQSSMWIKEDLPTLSNHQLLRFTHLNSKLYKHTPRIPTTVLHSVQTFYRMLCIYPNTFIPVILLPVVYINPLAKQVFTTVQQESTLPVYYKPTKILPTGASSSLWEPTEIPTSKGLSPLEASMMATTDLPPPLIPLTNDDKEMEKVYNASDTTTPPTEINRGISARFPNPLKADELAEVPITQPTESSAGQIMSSIHRRTHPIPSCQVLFHILNMVAYINLALVEQLLINIVTTQNSPWGHLPSMGTMAITTTIQGMTFTLLILIIPCISREYLHSIAFSTVMPPLVPITRKTLIGLTHRGMLV